MVGIDLQEAAEAIAPRPSPRFNRNKTILLYGCLCYIVFLDTFLYAIGFLANVLPRAMDSVVAQFRWSSVAIDLALLTVLAVQHSIMARPWFKRAWTRHVPVSAKRSTYVLFSSVALPALFWGNRLES